MVYLVVYIVNNIEDLPAILHAWEAAGVHGITVIESTGLRRIKDAWLQEDAPIFPSLENLFAEESASHRTLFAVVGERLVDVLLHATEKIVGELDESETGFFFTVPVQMVAGTKKVPGYQPPGEDRNSN